MLSQVTVEIRLTMLSAKTAGFSGFTYVTKKPELLLPEQKPSFTATWPVVQVAAVPAMCT